MASCLTIAAIWRQAQSIEAHLFPLEQDRKLSAGEYNGFHAVSIPESAGEIAQKLQLFALAGPSADDIKVGFMNSLTLIGRHDKRSAFQPPEQSCFHHRPRSEQRHPRIMKTG